MRIVKALLIALLFVPQPGRAWHIPPPHREMASAALEENKEKPVRGVSFDYFKNSVTEFKDSTNATLTDSAWVLWKEEQWPRLEQFFNDKKLNGGWPPNRGALSLKIVVLHEGSIIDRYGGYYDADSVFQDRGTFVSMKDVPFPQRALPDKTLSSPYRVYQVVKNIPDVKEGQIIPWFGKEGLGIQYELPYTINDLLKEGYLKAVKQSGSR